MRQATLHQAAVLNTRSQERHIKRLLPHVHKGKQATQKRACSSTVLLQSNWNTTAASVTCLVAETLYSVPSSVSSTGVLLLNTGPSAANSGTACSSIR